MLISLVKVCLRWLKTVSSAFQDRFLCVIDNHSKATLNFRIILDGSEPYLQNILKVAYSPAYQNSTRKKFHRAVFEICKYLKLIN